VTLSGNCAEEALDFSMQFLGRADSALQGAKLKVAVAATSVLIAKGAERATALKAAWNDAWRQYDWLSALADCRLHYAETSVPIVLPPDIKSLLQTMMSLDVRVFCGWAQRRSNARR
jgi:hypothetical protein